MAHKPLRLHPEAEQEYLAALAWYRDRSPTAAGQFQSAIRRAGQAIQRAPRRWPYYFGDFRRYTLHQFPFSLIYQEMISEVGSLPSPMAAADRGIGRAGSSAVVSPLRRRGRRELQIPERGSRGIPGFENRETWRTRRLLKEVADSSLRSE